MKILLALDGSEYSQTAIDTLKALDLSPQDTKVTITSVVPEYSFIGGLSLEALWDREKARTRFSQTHRRAVMEILARSEEQLQGTGFEIESKIGFGKPATSIVDTAHQMEAALVIIGYKGMGDSRYFPIGSVAQRVLKLSPCSVMLARGEVSRIERVVLAIDGSPYSEEAVRFLLDLRLKASVEVVLVSSLWSHAPGFLNVTPSDVDDDRDEIQEIQYAEEMQAQQLLENTEQVFDRNGYTTSTFLRKGEPAEEILSVVEMTGADLVVVGVRGVGKDDDFAMGSVPDKICRYASTSVLVVKPYNL